jgi:lipoate-protein ligase A
VINNSIKLPLLRVYGWIKPTLSIGANQSLNEPEKTYPIVKRATGGQAVLHGLPENELTYSVFIKYGYKVKQLYFEIGEILLGFLEDFGLKGEFGYSSKDYFKKFDCFNSKTEADIVINDIKVIGSAQYRKKDYVLQHGSIKLDIIRKLSGKNIDFEYAKVNFKKAFQDKLKIDFLDYTLTSSSNILCESNH